MTETAGTSLGDGAPKPAPRRGRRARGGLWLLLSLVLLAAAIGFGAMGLTGKPLRLPVWAVAEVESRLNIALDQAGSAAADVSVGAIDLTVGRDWVPRLRLEDLRLLRQGGAALLTLPEVRIAFDPAAVLEGRLRPRSVLISGARVTLRRLESGYFDLSFLSLGNPQINSFAALIDATDAIFALPVLADLRSVEAEALTLTLEDLRARRTWRIGDGRLALANRPDDLAMEVGLSLQGAAGRGPAQAQLTLVTRKGSPETRISATVDRVAAADVAATSLPIAWLGVLDAPISGRLSAALDATGRLATLEAALTIGAGALRPTPETLPIAFEKAGIALTYDPQRERLDITEATVQSASLRLAASGHSYLPGLAEGLPEAFLAQLRFADVSVDPEGLFEQPVRFSEGALDLRLKLDPFSVEIGQVTLVEDGRRLTGRGRVQADPEGWRLAFDVALNRITHDRLLALWPLALKPKTRDWLVQNVQEGELFDVQAAIRMQPGAETRLALGYGFATADVRFLKTLPPVEEGSGYAGIDGNRYVMVLDKGHVTPPQGGRIDVAGTVFQVPDMTERPSRAEIALRTRSSLTAALSLLDQPPFRFLAKAGQPVDLGTGEAEMLAHLRLPLVPRVTLAEVDYRVSGRLRALRSEVLVPGRVLTAPDLALSADATGLRISGPGRLGQVPFDVTYAQGFGPQARGRARIDGRVTLSPAVVSEFGLGLPRGMVSGEGPARIAIDLQKGQPPRLELTSTLAGIGLALPELGWSKPASRDGRLSVLARLGRTPVVDSLTLEGSGLEAAGRITLRDGGGLAEASFARVTLNGWLDAAVTLAGRGAGRAPAVTVSNGRVDLRRMTLGKGGGSGRDGGPLTLALDRLTVTEGIALTAFRGEFTPNGGFNGRFQARMNGAAPVQGTVVPSAAGSAVRLRSDDAGGVLAASGIFPNARGGALDLTLTPTGPAGHYTGRAAITDIRLRRAPVLAELVNAISVVGLLEKLNGPGLVFSNADADFRLTPTAIEITRGSAVGASLGVSMAGVYTVAGKRLEMQGVVSPIYLLNGIGAIFTRPGEGLFGFNYSLRGTADTPRVSVNPLSILTPGMFREIFRSPAPVLPKGAG